MTSTRRTGRAGEPQAAAQDDATSVREAAVDEPRVLGPAPHPLGVVDARMKDLFGPSVGVPPMAEYVRAGIDRSVRQGQIEFLLPNGVPDYPPRQFVMDQKGFDGPQWMRQVLDVPENRRMYYEMDTLMNTGTWLERAIIAQQLVARMLASDAFKPEELVEMLALLAEYQKAAMGALQRRKSYFELISKYGYQIANGMDRYLRNKAVGEVSDDDASAFLKELLAQEQKALAKLFGGNRDRGDRSDARPDEKGDKRKKGGTPPAK